MQHSMLLLKVKNLLEIYFNMKNIAILILGFTTGFFITALIIDIDNPDLLFKKAIFSCITTIIALMLLFINYLLNIKKKNE